MSRKRPSARRGSRRDRARRRARRRARLLVCERRRAVGDVRSRSRHRSGLGPPTRRGPSGRRNRGAAARSTRGSRSSATRSSLTSTSCSIDSESIRPRCAWAPSSCHGRSSVSPRACGATRARTRICGRRSHCAAREARASRRTSRRRSSSTRHGSRTPSPAPHPGIARSIAVHWPVLLVYSRFAAANADASDGNRRPEPVAGRSRSHSPRRRTGSRRACSCRVLIVLAGLLAAAGFVARLRGDPSPPEGARARAGTRARASHRPDAARAGARAARGRKPRGRNGGSSTGARARRRGARPRSSGARARGAHARVVGGRPRASSRRAASRPGCGRRSTRTGTAVGRSRRALERIARPSSGVDTHGIGGFALGDPADRHRAPRARRWRGGSGPRRGRDGTRSADERARARPAGSHRRRRPRPLAQHHGRRLRRRSGGRSAGSSPRTRTIGLAVFSDVALRASSAGDAGGRARSPAPTPRRAATRAGHEPVDADVPRGNAHLERTRTREVDARARRGRQRGRSCSSATSRRRRTTCRRSPGRSTSLQAADIRLRVVPLGAVERRAQPLLGAPREGCGRRRSRRRPTQAAPVPARRRRARRCVFLVLGRTRVRAARRARALLRPASRSRAASDAGGRPT